MDNSNPQDLQALVQELQLARNQIQTVSTQINEISLTLESLSKQDKNRPVFRAVGNLLLEVDDRDELVKELSLSKPLVVRLAGTNVEEGKNILSQSGLKIIPADDLDDAAVKIVSAVKESN